MNHITFAQLNEAYHKGVYGQEKTLDIQEWVEALIDEGYDLDQYSDDELYEAYLFDLKEAKVDSNLTPLQKIRKRNQDPSLVMPVGQQTAERRAYHKGGRGVKKEKGEKSAFGTMRHIGGPYKEELDLYDLVSEYLVSEGFCDSYEDADVIMANMSEEWREGIVEEVLEGVADQSDKQIDKGIATTYNATGVLVNQRSPALNHRVHYADKDDKIKRMEKRIENRRKDLFKEKDRREDENLKKLKKMLGL